MIDLVFKILSLVIIAVSFLLFLANKKKYYKFLFVTLLLFPKVNLIGVTGSNTGIRCDDFLILSFFLLSIGDIIVSLKRSSNLTTLHTIMVIWVVMGLFSTLIGMVSGTVSSPIIGILTSLRKYEYFVAFFIGYFYFLNYSQKDFIKTVKVSSVILLVICLLQYVRVIGGFIGGTYQDEVGFPIGVFNGAYEYACFMCLMFAVMFYDAFKRSSLSFLYCLIILAQIVLSQSRSGLLLSVAVILLMSFAYSKIVFVSLIVMGSMAIFIIANVTTAFERFLTIDILQMVNTMFERFEAGDYYSALKELPTESMFPYVTSDLSFYVRTTKWGAALNGFSMNPLFGYGPGQLSVLDGSYIKILCEGGIVSFIIFLFMIYELSRNYTISKTPVLKWMLFAIICFGLFIDIFDSSKIMECMWMVTGLSFAVQKQEIRVKESNVLALQESI